MSPLPGLDLSVARSWLAHRQLVFYTQVTHSLPPAHVGGTGRSHGEINHSGAWKQRELFETVEVHTASLWKMRVVCPTPTWFPWIPRSQEVRGSLGTHAAEGLEQQQSL